MQENEFEKQLKNAMEDFRLSPSAPVWEKVKKKLEEKKRRRLPFFFLLAAGLITAGYFTYHFSKHHQQNEEKIVADKNINVPKTNLPDSGNINDQENIANQNINDTSLKSAQKSLHYNINLYSKEKVVKQINTDIVINEKTAAEKQNIRHKNSKAKQNVNIKNQKEKTDNTVLDNTQIQQSLPTIQPSKLSNDSSGDQQKIKDDARKDLASVNKDSVTTAKDSRDNISNPVTKKPGKTYKNPNWKFGITASYGRSKLTQKTNNSNSYTPQYLNSGVGGGITPTTVSNSHPFSSSNAFSIGAVIQKKIFKNVYISSGINFTHLSVSSNVNKKIDSLLTVPTSNNINSFYAVNGYYQAGSSKVYTSKYNFIEIPVSFQQYIFQSKQTSLSYNAGFSVRELLSSNALIYNPNSNVFFSKNDVLRKTQFQVLAGLNVEINTGKNSSIFIGPQISYSLSNLAKNENIGSFHFINYGLQAGFLLHKK